nr:PPOX class F420-dependent oxidoreductase [Nocardia lijiangensis]
MSFTEEEVEYLRTQRLARVATVDPDGQPDVVPVGYEFDGTHIYIGGWDPVRTRKYRNVERGNPKVAIVIDDLVSTDPWIPRYLRVYGTAELVQRQGEFGPARYMCITPHRFVELQPRRSPLHPRGRAGAAHRPHPHRDRLTTGRPTRK